MHERKRVMLELADAAIALPGGCGTLEELFEAITWKRLGLFFGPVVLVNVNRFFDPCIDLLQRCVDEKFMDEKHREMWSIASGPEDVLTTLHSCAEWSLAKSTCTRLSRSTSGDWSSPHDPFRPRPGGIITRHPIWSKSTWTSAPRRAPPSAGDGWSRCGRFFVEGGTKSIQTTSRISPDTFSDIASGSARTRPAMA